ncbi:MAG: hypothetical protein IBJ14_05010 [Hydrogenophaga sp.]|nr:hypothetical protein [Hydrogenophaga sp.]
MPASFAALEDRVNRAVLGHLSNAMATIGASTVPVVIDRLYIETLDGEAAGYAPVVLGKDVDLVGVAYGTTVVVHGIGYTVTAVEPDGTGLTRLQLRRA